MRLNQPMAWNRRFLGVVTVCAMLTAAWPALSAPPRISPEALGQLFDSMRLGTLLEAPDYSVNTQGFVTFLSAPQGASFAVSAAKSAGPEASARAFLEAQSGALGTTSAQVSFRTVNVQTLNNATYVRFQQQYAGVDVFGAQVVVQLNAEAAVVAVVSDILTDTSLLDDGSIALGAVVGAAEAEAKAGAALAAKKVGKASEYKSIGPVRPVIYAPAVVGEKGPVRLTWLAQMSAGQGEGAAQNAVLIDAQGGGVILDYSLNPKAMERTVYDAQFTTYESAWSVIRAEGSAASGEPDADNLYDFLGASNDYFYTLFGRDSWDGMGSPIYGVINLPFLAAEIGMLQSGVPAAFFVEGMISDDVVAHEFTHVVTASTIAPPYGLIYMNESGALAEGYSDIYGEIIDWHIPWGNDAEAARWYMGEDTNEAIYGGAIRYLKDPTVFGLPDRRGSSLWINTEAIDGGGVHYNCGVLGKLAYLLIDGDYFNGYTIRSMGEDAVSRLFYQAMHILTESADFYQMAQALAASASTLGWSYEDRLNLASAIRAVEIEPPVAGVAANLAGLTSFRAVPTRNQSGDPVIALAWNNPVSGNVPNVRLQRSVSAFTQKPDNGALLVSGNIASYVDSNVQPDVEYFYTLLVTLDSGLPQVAFASAVADAQAPGVLTESFSEDRPFDLSYSQLLFTPISAATGAFGGPAGTGQLGDYEATLRRNVTSLPVAFAGDDGTGRYLPLSKNGTTPIELFTSVPFFGRSYGYLQLAANGYIAFLPVAASDALNQPSLEAHYAIPRISFLFSKLAPNINGKIWSKVMEDRVVVTFEDISEDTGNSTYTAPPNTVQAELFYSGHIRITYLDANLENAIVGLSDGRGLPLDPQTISPDLEAVPVLQDLSWLASEGSRLSIDPISPLYLEEGDVASFDVQTSPGDLSPVPVLRAQWNGPIEVPFGDNLDGTGAFSWSTGTEDEGQYSVRVTATSGDMSTYQDVPIYVYNHYAAPSAQSLGLGTDDDGDNPYVSRSVLYGRALTALYTYTHPELATESGMYAEGQSIIYWYRNGQVVAGFTGIRTIPADKIAPRDVWYFEVIPVTVTGIVGASAKSPSVTIAGEPVIDAVVPAYGLTSGGETVRIRGHFLSGPQEVLFGGVRALDVRMISDEEIEVTTPTYAGEIQVNDENSDLVDVVDVSITTPAGTGYLPDAFTYKTVKDGPISTEGEDKTQRLLFCGSVEKTPSAWDAALVLVALLLLAVRGRCSISR